LERTRGGKAQELLRAVIGSDRAESEPQMSAERQPERLLRRFMSSSWAFPSSSSPALPSDRPDSVGKELSVPSSVAGSRRLGRIPVLFVRMNADLLMGEDLKKTGAANLFTVFGEPDVEISTDEDDHVWS
jgi:hypothetical protein